MNINRRKVHKDYLFYKRKAFEYWNQGDVRKAMISVCACGELAYGYFCEESFGDDELDELLYQMGKAKFTIPVVEQQDDKRVVFFDSFASDNRGITEQYLDALHYNGYEILFVTSNTQFSNESKLGKLLVGYKNCRVVVLPDPNHIIPSANQVAQEIAEWHASKAFIHIGPYDILPIMLFSQYAGVLHRYFINLTDHAWWLGRNCIDMNLEFRQFGLALSTKVRGIDKTKEAMLPYYPVSELGNETIDDLLPEGLEGKFVIVTGGSFYKYLDADFTLLKIVQRVLKENENAVLLMVGTGKAGELYKQKVEEKGLKNRIFLMAPTPYLLSVFEHAHLYLNSYPLGGSLMGQIAAKQGLPVVAYSKMGMDFNDSSDICYSGAFVMHTDKDDFCHFVRTLILDPKAYEQYKQSFHYDEDAEKAQFRDSLKSVMVGTHVLPKIKDYDGVQKKIGERMSKIHCDIENEYYHVYPSHIAYYNNLLQIQTEASNKKKMKDWFIRKIAASQKQAEEYRHEKNWQFVSSRFKQLGDGAHAVYPYYIYGQWNIEVGQHFAVGPNFWMEAIDCYGSQKFAPSIKIGDNFNAQRNCHLGAIDSITIGNGVLLGSNILIIDHAHGDTSAEQNKLAPDARPLYSKGSVVIGNNVWIGDNAIILPGVTLGDGCVVGAGAVVTKSFPSGSVIGGNPAKQIKKIEK